MSPVTTNPSAVPGTPSPPKPTRRRGARRTTSLFAAGEPWIWLTGGALSLAVLMILLLLGMVLRQGLPTFWPDEVVRLELSDGSSVMGEVAGEQSYTPEVHVFEQLPDDQREAARLEVESTGGVAGRTKLRTGNFDLDGTHYEWVNDFSIRSRTEPEWALVVERLSDGRFYGTPTAFAIDGETLATEPGEVFDLFNQHHPSVRQRWRERRRLETKDVGEVNAQEERARLRLRGVELEHGKDSPEWRAESERFEAVAEVVTREFQRISDEIRSIDEVNDRYQMVLVTAQGREKSLGLAEVVRAHAPNRMGWLARLRVYLSRTWEFLSDDPREANSEGGVMPAIFGTVAMTLIMSILVVPFGVLAALYLREYAKQGALVSIVRIAVNNLAGVPSIVFGVFGLGFFCYIVGTSIDELFFETRLPSPTYGTGGLLWASFTLALLTLPVVIVPTEEALASVPSSMREGSYACGATKWQTIRRIVLPRAMPGIMTGMILAIARGAGEVAPLMLVGAVKLVRDLPIDGTAPYIHPERSFMHLGFHIYDLGFQSQNSEAARPMVFTTTLLLIGIVVALNLLAIWGRARLRRRFQAG